MERRSSGLRRSGLCPWADERDGAKIRTPRREKITQSNDAQNDFYSDSDQEVDNGSSTLNLVDMNNKWPLGGGSGSFGKNTSVEHFNFLKNGIDEYGTPIVKKNWEKIPNRALIITGNVNVSPRRCSNDRDAPLPMEDSARNSKLSSSAIRWNNQKLDGEQNHGHRYPATRRIFDKKTDSEGNHAQPITTNNDNVEKKFVIPLLDGYENADDTFKKRHLSHGYYNRVNSQHDSPFSSSTSLTLSPLLSLPPSTSSPPSSKRQFRHLLTIFLLIQSLFTPSITAEGELFFF